MNKKALAIEIILLIVIIIVIILVCFNKKEVEKVTNDNKNASVVKVIIKEKEYDLNLEDNDTAIAFTELLPLEIEMQELNGNEKYHYLDNNLPSDAQKVEQINKGDVMLYGNDCIVIFYKTFNTTYKYTKIGHIDDLPDLSSDNILVKIN